MHRFRAKVSHNFKAPIILETPRGTERFALIDAIRGIAALGIAAYHIHRYGPLPKAADRILPPSIQSLLDQGCVAVPLFFIISGFVAAYSLRNARITPIFAGNFALRRLIRLGAPYWCTVIFVHVLSYWSMHVPRDESLAEELTSPQIMAQLCFLQDILGYDNVSAGMWFIAIDLQFGLLFVMLLCIVEGFSGGWIRSEPGLIPSEPSKFSSEPGRPRPRPPSANAGLPSSAVSTGGQATRGTHQFRQIFLLAAIFPLALYALFVANRNPSQDAWIWYFFHLPALGALTWWALERRISPAAFWLLVGAMALGMFFCWRSKMLVAAVAGILLYLSGRIGKLDALRNRPLQYLGRISYSLFLIHYPVSCLVLSLGYHLTGTQPVPALLWLIAALAASLGAAHLLHEFIEAPANRLARRLKPLRP